MIIIAIDYIKTRHMKNTNNHLYPLIFMKKLLINNKHVIDCNHDK